MTTSTIKSHKSAKIISTVLIFGAIALQICQALIPLPPLLSTLSSITQVVLIIHGVEGIIAAALIAFYRQGVQNKPTAQSSSLLIDHLPQNTLFAVIKAGLYAFFVGTVGLLEIIKATKEEKTA